MKATKNRSWLFYLLLFLLAFLPRAVQPVSRPLVWYLRSARFINSVLAADWANTVYSEHGGAALMWPAGVGLKLYWTLSGVTPSAANVPAEVDPIQFFGPVPVAEIAAALLPVALLIALGVIGIYYLLHRLLDRTTAAVAALLVALTPYHVAQSKILHLDGLLSTLMLLAALAALVYLREQRWRWLLVSGLLGGLGWLTKPVALYLLPYTALVLGLDALVPALQKFRDQGLVAATSSLGRRLMLPLLAWTLVAVLTFVLLWPVMWVDPGRGLDAIRWGITHHVSTAHDSPNFFAGEITTEDPGLPFYGMVLLFKSTSVELAFLAAALVLGAVRLARQRRLALSSPTVRVYLMLAAFALFYTLQMSLAAKKLDRYMLPVVLCLDLGAAVGIVAWARKLAPRLARLATRSRRSEALKGSGPYWAILALPLLAQAALSLPHHPYYSAAYNWLAGGPRVAARTILTGTEGEGLDQIARVLNQRPGSGDLTVATQLKHVFSQYFHGRTLDIYQPADYLVFHRNYTVRNYKVEEWGRLWERYAARAPEQEIEFDGVPYTWLYPAFSSETLPENPLEVRLDGRFRFLGYDLRSAEVAPGDRVPLVLYWQATEPVTDDLSIFLHLLDPGGQLIWQDDGAADHGARPTWSWEAGEVIADPHTLVLPRDLLEGDYLLVTGLYDWRSGKRMTGVTAEDQPLDKDQIAVATLTVRQPSTQPETWFARGLAGLVLLSALAVSWGSDE